MLISMVLGTFYSDEVYHLWIGGFTDTAKSKKLSVYDANWKRIGQFSLSKVKLLRRNNKLCIARAARSTSLGYCVEPRDSRGNVEKANG